MSLPGVCVECRQPVVYVAGRWRDAIRRGLGMPHVCQLEPVPAAPVRVCWAWMPKAGDHCARRPGHAYGHRSPYAMSNDNRMRTGRVLAK